MDEFGVRSAIGDPVSASGEALQMNRSRAEKAAMDALAERLAVQFPELPADEITRTIRGEYEGFDTSPIRDFIPVLVERKVLAELHGPPMHRA